MNLSVGGNFDQMMKQKKISIALIQGDIAGIGPELLVKLLLKKEVRQRANLIVIGAIESFQRGLETTGKKIDVVEVDHVDKINFSKGAIHHLNLDIPGIADVPFSQVSSKAGKSSLRGLEKGLDLYREGMIQGICFMPFNKKSMHLGGNDFNDEMGFCRAYLNYDGAVSEFNVVDGLWNGRVTSHVALKDVSKLITYENVLQAIELADRTLAQAGYAKPRIAVSGLNPHAGDDGLIGTEEIKSILPAIEEAKKRGMNIKGPFPGDTVYLQAREGFFDAVVTMYHDQGQVAIKMMGFDRGVSVMGGLPVPITTPAHGTAFDIANKNEANVIPTYNAFMMVVKMAEGQLKKNLVQSKVLLIVEKSGHCMAYYDVEKKQLLKRINLPNFPHEFVVSQNEQYAFVGHYGVVNSGDPGLGGNSIFVIEIATGTIVNQITLEQKGLENCRRPHGVELDRQGRLYVLSESADRLFVSNNPVENSSFDFSVPTGGKKGHLFALTKDGQRAFVCNLDSNNVTVIHPHDRSFKPIVLETGSNPEGRCLSPDEKKLYITNRGSHTISVIDLMSMKLEFSFSTHQDPTRVFYDREHDRLLVTHYLGKALSVFEAATGKILKVYPLVSNPITLSFIQGGEAVMVSFMDNKVRMYDLENYDEFDSMEVGDEPDISYIIAHQKLDFLT